MTRLRTCLLCGRILIGEPGPRCAECRRDWRRRYDESRPEHHRFYATLDWRRLSAEVRDGATRCHWCLKPTRRLVADHVEPLDKRPDLALERSNLVASCVPCNTRRGRNAKLPDLDGRGADRTKALSTGLPARPERHTYNDAEIER